MTAKKPPEPKSSIEVIQDADDLELYEQLKDLGGGASIQVYREPNREFLETVEPDAVELESLKAMFGGGSFSLRARRDGTWIKGVSMVRVRIAGPPKPGSPGQPLPGEVTATAAVPHLGLTQPYPPGSLEALRYEFDAYKAAQRSESSSSSMVAMMTTLLVPVLTTALERQPENSAVEILELARKLAKDQREAAGAAPDTDPIRDLGIPLLNVLQRGLPEPEKRPALNPGPVEQPLESETEPKALPSLQEIAVRIGAWCEPLERRDADPAMRAWCFLEDMQDSPLLPRTMELIHLPNALEAWARVTPRVNERREWYASFVEELRRLTTDDPDADDPERDAGHEADTQGDGEAVEASEPDAGNTGARA